MPNWTLFDFAVLFETVGFPAVNDVGSFYQLSELVVCMFPHKTIGRWFFDQSQIDE